MTDCRRQTFFLNIFSVKNALKKICWLKKLKEEKKIPNYPDETC